MLFKVYGPIKSCGPDKLVSFIKLADLINLQYFFFCGPINRHDNLEGFSKLMARGVGIDCVGCAWIDHILRGLRINLHDLWYLDWAWINLSDLKRAGL